MAYSAPAWDEVDFDFVDSPYVPPGGGFILADMAGEVAPSTQFELGNNYTQIFPPVTQPDWELASFYQVLLSFPDPPPVFPLIPSYDTVTTFNFSTGVVADRSGSEFRNISWQTPLNNYDLAFTIRNSEDLYEVIKLFQTMKGQEGTFRFLDPYDSSSADLGETITNLDQFLGFADGIVGFFQLVRRYDCGLYSYTRTVTHPVEAGLVVAVDGVTKAGILDPNTGRYFMDVLPTAGQKITAGFNFYKECRFGTDTLSTNLENYKLGSMTLPIREVRQ